MLHVGLDASRPFDMRRLKEAMLLPIANDAPLDPECAVIDMIEGEADQAGS